MIRTIIHIEEDKCNGCGLCVSACQEGAIGLIDGKAVLLRDDYCDGLGNCLPVCPTDAIHFVEREAAAFDEEAVQANMKKQEAESSGTPFAGCPGTMMKSIKSQPVKETKPASTLTSVPSQLNQWPVQLKLVAPNAPYLNNSHLLIAADCTAYAYGNFHQDFMKNKVTLIGCPKLDEGDYSEKLHEILTYNTIKSVTIVRMEVPCCGGIVNAATAALKSCDKMIPWNVVTVSIDGTILEA